MNVTFMTALSIFEWAIESECCRVVFYVDSKYITCEPTLDAIKKVFCNGDDLSKMKVKLQDKIDGKFTDVTRYKKIVESKSLSMLLQKYNNKFDESEFITLFNQCLEYGCYNELNTFYRKSLYRHMRALHKNSKDNIELNELINAFKKISKLSSKDEFNFYICYLTIFNSMNKFIISGESNDELFNRINSFVDSELHEFEGRGKQAATNLILGSVASVYNRVLAKKLFDDVSEKAPDLVNLFGMDVGVFTYFDDYDEIKNNTEIETSVQEISMSGDFPKNNMALCFSVDEKFLQGYGPLISFYAKHFNEFDFHLLIVNPNNETVDKFRKFLKGLDCLTGNENSNIYISTFKSPNYCRNDITLSACARFILAKKILKEYESLYIMDADLSWNDCPKSFFNKLANYDIAVNKSGNEIAYLSPWRRYLAGNLYLTKSAENILDDIVMYIVYGLREENSWMLDQNAICFSLENNSIDSIAFLNDFKRPFTQENLRNTIEINTKYW